MTKKLLIAFFAMFMMAGIAVGQNRLLEVGVSVISPTASEATISVTIEDIYTESQQQKTIPLSSTGPISGPNKGKTTFSVPDTVVRLIIEVTTNAMEGIMYVHDGYVSNVIFDFR